MHGFRAQSQKTFQNGVVVIISVIDSKGQRRKVCDRYVAEPRFSCRKNIRIQGISDTSPGKCESALNSFCEVPLFRRKVYQNAVLNSED